MWYVTVIQCSDEAQRGWLWYMRSHSSGKWQNRCSNPGFVYSWLFALPMTPWDFTAPTASGLSLPNVIMKLELVSFLCSSLMLRILRDKRQRNCFDPLCKVHTTIWPLFYTPAAPSSWCSELDSLEVVFPLNLSWNFSVHSDFCLLRDSLAPLSPKKEMPQKPWTIQ